MPNSFSPSRIERLKREAKQLRQNSPITHSEALDSIAKDNGYGNWSLLMRHVEAPSTTPAMREQETPIPSEFIFSRTSDEMRTALRVIPFKRYGPRPDEAARKEVADICLAFVSAANAVDFAIGYIECLLTVPRFSIRSGAKVYHEMRRWLPYQVQPIDDGHCILLNRHYKPIGITSSEWVDYNDFQHLHLQLDIHQLEKLAHTGSGQGYLFNDGCTPWHGRSEAKAYLERLRTLKAILGANK
ncbi:glyoxalase superfamily protein [Ferribacterium limneticum]|uniref:glyoxalase superfamily protein n=1 Tax=Ferribacterium limneticum TaxID=76259 RepID=UPI001CF8C2D1|nr:glyoxalase superfamily protein [Ferribacterium limneticum]UCV22509.1 hypothetical protein KI613_18660 [Ferribacterium limneticum]